MVFLVILFGLISFLGLFGPPLRITVTLRGGRATQPVTSFSKGVGALPVHLHHVAARSISLGAAKSVIAKRCQAVTNAAGYLAALARPIFCNFGSNKAVSEASRSRFIRNRERGRRPKRIVRYFKDTVKCTHRNSTVTPYLPVTVTPKTFNWTLC